MDSVIPGVARSYVVHRDLVERTVFSLRSTGAGRREAVALWIGRMAPAAVVERLVTPDQEAGALHFSVPLQARLRLARELAASGEVVLVQVHTHPAEAFHSPVDDRLAIPQHIGGISIVVPRFALEWNGDLGETSVNVHLGGGRWRELAPDEARRLIRVIP